MSNWTRRELVKAGMAASVASVAGSNLLGEISKASSVAGVSAGAVSDPSAELAPGNHLRERELLDFGWRFALGNSNDPAKDFGYGKLSREGTFAKAGRIGGPADPRFNDISWRQVDIPHDWAVDLPFVNDPMLVEHGGKALGREFPETSIGWYRRVFDIPASDEGRRISVELDGIFRNATLFLNGHYITENLSGYAPAELDATDFLNYGEKNYLVVRVDATLDEGWFYEGAGIYRHVWLLKTAPVHIARWGNYVRSSFPNGVKGEAELAIRTEVENESDEAVFGRVRAAVLDTDGKTVATVTSKPATIAAGDSFTFHLQTNVTQPALWSVDTPKLYQLVTAIEADGKLVDQDATTFGIRKVHFDAAKGFFLNDQSVKIKGTCNHQDHAGVGAAIPDALQAYRLKLLKEMGSNSIRTSHNPPTPELLDACDRMGMMVLDEARMMSSNPEGMSELQRLIKRDRNHPSIILWSLGNEEPEQGSTRGARMVTTMKKLQRKLDPSRSCTVAMNGDWGKGVSNVVDVVGLNYRLQRIDDYHQAYPTHPLIGTETASTLSTRGIYETDKERGYITAYDTYKPDWGDLAEDWWTFYDEREWLAGGFLWTGFDYRGETTPYKWPCISSHFGVMDTCGFPKDNYFYYQAWWSGKPVLHILPHWNWPGKEGQEIEVWVYCNQESVELFLNDKSLGSKAVRKNGHLVWKVKYQPGTLLAKGKKSGKVLIEERAETVGTPAKILLHPDRTTLAADGQDCLPINVTVVDAQGRVVPTANNLLTFKVSGAGNVIGLGNGDPSCHEPDKPGDDAARRSVFNGLAQVIVQASKHAGELTVQATSPRLESATVTVAVEGPK